MENSILETIKFMLDLTSTTTFDTDLKVMINSALMTLRQHGIGAEGIRIVTGEETWAEFLSGLEMYDAALDYVYCNVKVKFDSTISGTYKDTLLQSAAEDLWRLKEA